MYYEEKIINGILHYRGNPFDAWTPKTLEGLTEILQREREESKALRIKLIKAEEALAAIQSLGRALECLKT
jgi:hypothetical protein